MWSRSALVNLSEATMWNSVLTDGIVVALFLVCLSVHPGLIVFAGLTSLLFNALHEWQDNRQEP
jgi:hypothetical protein